MLGCVLGFLEVSVCIIHLEVSVHRQDLYVPSSVKLALNIVEVVLEHRNKVKQETLRNK